jgi:Domain of unknown function (DUF4386)
MLRKLTAGVLIAVPVLFSAGYSLLSARFDYPLILKHSSDEILRRFEAHSAALLPGWYTLFLAAALFIPLSTLVADRYAPRSLASLARSFGLAAGVVQAAGLARWVFLVPSLAARYVATTDPAEQVALRTVFEAFHHYAGNGLGEHLGYLFTGLWSLLIARGLWERSRILSVVGALSALAIFAGLLEPLGLQGVGAVNALGYVAWSLWLIALGIKTARSGQKENNS